MKKLVVASGNGGKLVEIRAILEGCGLELVPQSEFDLPEAEETGASFIENALLKARQATRATGLPALADDSGLMVDALHGAPGLITAHYAGVHGDAKRNIARLLGELEGIPQEHRSARFYSVVVVLRNADDPAPLIAEGEWYGRILEAPRGSGGFGYDPVFLDPESGLSGAELEPARKNLISHRGKALAALRARLRELV